jgi:hypothetical protein
LHRSGRAYRRQREHHVQLVRERDVINSFSGLAGAPTGALQALAISPVIVARRDRAMARVSQGIQCSTFGSSSVYPHTRSPNQLSPPQPSPRSRTTRPR